MHYLIFLPNQRGGNPKHLVEAGLADLMLDGDDGPMCADLVGRGPGDLPGQVWAWGNAIPAYLPEQQVWTRCGPGWWMGTSVAAPPVSDDLRRKHTVDGLEQEMADGRAWRLPNVMRLPMTVELNASTFEIEKTPTARYRSFADESVWALQAVIDGVQDLGNPDWKRALDFAVMALGVNYRINAAIAVRLGILDESLLFTIMAKATDTEKIQQVMEEVKKKGVALGQSG